MAVAVAISPISCDMTVETAGDLLIYCGTG